MFILLTIYTRINKSFLFTRLSDTHILILNIQQFRDTNLTNTYLIVQTFVSTLLPLASWRWLGPEALSVMHCVTRSPIEMNRPTWHDYCELNFYQ